MAFVGNLENNTLSGGGVAPFGAGFGGYGGGFGGGFGGFGGIAPIGLVGINNLFGRDRDHDHGGHGCKGRDNDDFEHPLAILAAIANAKDQTVAEGRAAAAAFSVVNDNVKDGNYAAAIQAERNTAQLSSQAQAFAIAATAQFNEVKEAGVAQTAAILARINQSEVDRLRDELHETRRGRDLDSIRIENNNTNTNIQAQFQAQAQLQLQRELEENRRRFDSREIEINNINTNTNVQAQLQAQAQAQLVRDFDEHKRRWDARENEINITNVNTNVNAQAQAQAQAQNLRDLDRDHRWNARFDALQSATAKANNEIINIGGLVAASQANTANPTNVNSKQS